MGYYLSKGNKAIIEMFIPKLLKSEENIVFKVNNPKRFERLIRSACSLPEYTWIKEKFIVRVQEDLVIFVNKFLHPEEVEAPIEEIHNKDFFDIINLLVLQKREKVNFINPNITQDELDNIIEWGKSNAYNIGMYAEGIAKILKVTKINNYEPT